MKNLLYNVTNNKKDSTLYEVRIAYTRPLLDTVCKVQSARDIHNLMLKVYTPESIDHKEYFYVMLLNRSYHVLGICEIGRGSANQVVVNVPEIFQLCLLTNASALVVVHNHPSGSLQPSAQDKVVTKRIKKIAKLFGIDFIDHLILTSESYFSFAEDGII